MRVIYIAGPYRSDSTYGVFNNIRKAEQAAIKVWKAGDYALCPHLNTQLFDLCTDIPLEVFLAGGLELLRRCDSILLLKGFEFSEGARAELELAQKIGLEILFEE